MTVLSVYDFNYTNRFPIYSITIKIYNVYVSIIGVSLKSISYTQPIPTREQQFKLSINSYNTNTNHPNTSIHCNITSFQNKHSMNYYQKDTQKYLESLFHANTLTIQPLSTIHTACFIFIQ